MKEMPDLKFGMIVKNKKYDCLFTVDVVGTDCVYVHAMYNTNLMEVISSDEIEAIYKYDSCAEWGISEDLSLSYKKIWERPELKEMTMSEVCKALGHEVKIVKG